MPKQKKTAAQPIPPIPPMPRKAYYAFAKKLPKDICLFCEYESFQVVIREWKHWVLIQDIAPYFHWQSILIPKRHICSLDDFRPGEKREFWKAGSEIIEAYRSLGVEKVRLQIHLRLTKTDIPTKGHFHAQYYQFRDGDFKTIALQKVYKEPTANLLRKALKEAQKSS